MMDFFFARTMAVGTLTPFYSLATCSGHSFFFNSNIHYFSLLLSSVNLANFRPNPGKCPFLRKRVLPVQSASSPLPLIFLIPNSCIPSPNWWGKLIRWGIAAGQIIDINPNAKWRPKGLAAGRKFQSRTRKKTQPQPGSDSDLEGNTKTCQMVNSLNVSSSTFSHLGNLSKRQLIKWANSSNELKFCIFKANKWSYLFILIYK